MALKKINIYHDLKLILEQARTSAVRAVNFSMVVAYWKIGERIVEEELKEKKRAQYGEKLIEELSIKLTTDFGKGFTVTNIKYMRLFYITFPIGHALRDQLPAEKKQLQISHALRDQSFSKKKKMWDVLRPELSWTHYRLLLGVENIETRKYYMNEAAGYNWSTRLLEREITSFYFERLLSSKKKKELLLFTGKESKIISAY